MTMEIPTDANRLGEETRRRTEARRWEQVKAAMNGPQDVLAEMVLDLFLFRLQTDPGAYREVFRHLVEDPMPMRHYEVLATALVKDAPNRRGKGHRKIDKSTERRIRRDYFAHLFEPVERKGDDRRRTTQPTSFESMAAALGPLTTPEDPDKDASDRVPYWHLIQLFPETWQWSKQGLEMWHRILGWNHEAQPFALPDGDLGARIDALNQMMTTIELPRRWFETRYTLQQRIEWLGQDHPWTVSDDDLMRLAKEWAGADDVSLIPILEDGAWALLHGKRPDLALKVAQAGLNGKFGKSPWWNRLGHALTLAYEDGGDLEGARAAARHWQERSKAIDSLDDEIRAGLWLVSHDVTEAGFANLSQRATAAPPRNAARLHASIAHEAAKAGFIRTAEAIAGRALDAAKADGDPNLLIRVIAELPR